MFNDAGKGVVKGSINYELPLNAKQLTEMHSFYPDQQSLEVGLVRPALNKSVYLTGTMMTSYESYKEKRSMLTQLVEDQTQNGVYRTRTTTREVEEETTWPRRPAHPLEEAGDGGRDRAQRDWASRCEPRTGNWPASACAPSTSPSSRSITTPP